MVGKASADLTKYFYVNYGLIEPPEVTSDYLQIQNKGTVYAKSRKMEPPFSPQVIPSSQDNSRMVYFWITQYSINTLLYQAHATGLLKYQITKAMLPPSDQPVLDMVCGQYCIGSAFPGLPPNDQPVLDMVCGQYCIGSAFPEVASRYQDYSVDVGLESTSMPRATLSTNRMTIEASVMVDFKLRSPSNRLSSLASLNVSASLTFAPSIRNDILGGRVQSPSLELSDVKLVGGKILNTPTVLDTILTKLFAIVVVPKLNVLTVQGFHLPGADGFSLRNAIVNVRPGYIMIGSDMAVHWFTFAA
ncbi:hypothetical protein EGW08_012185 [Elysia chlorotica]|uniref:Lipid-binding serum glycoprotein C-terminal domain-containing protein n=1 Tax=Elysia chlorotica TaxID=188477 RepID=A0A433TES6_ELYCH|nr:hypothetical protein EGW08_012185 [Elysia chlorotica]